jgi:hypothetical protein
MHKPFVPAWQNWVISGVFVLISVVGAYAFNAIDSRMSTSETRIIALEQSSIVKRERLSALEAREEGIEKSLSDIKSSLDTLIKMHLRSEALELKKK